MVFFYNIFWLGPLSSDYGIGGRVVCNLVPHFLIIFFMGKNKWTKSIHLVPYFIIILFLFSLNATNEKVLVYEVERKKRST